MSDLTSRAFGLGLSDLFGVGLARCPRSSLIISLFVRCPGRRPVRSNNCSLTHAAASWIFEHLELLFVPDGPATDWVSDSDFTIVRYSAQYLEQRVLTYAFARPVWCFSNYCSFLPGRKLLEEPKLKRTIVRSYQLACQGIISYDINYIRC